MFAELIETIEDRSCEKSLDFLRGVLLGLYCCQESLKDKLPEPMPVEHYDRRVIFCREDVEAVLATWPPGVFTLPHNHGVHQTHGMVRVLRGRIENRIYRQSAEKLTLLDTLFHEADELIKVPKPLIHAMGNPSSEEVAVSLHIYAPKIEEVKYWHPETLEPWAEPDTTSVLWPPL